jgi:cysteine desulfurase
MKEMYLDANAHQCPSAETLKYYGKLAGELHGHPLSLTKPGRKAAQVLEDARDKIAELIGAKTASQIIFTSGCTQACEWAIEIYKNLDLDLDLLCSKMEHPAMRDPVSKLTHFSWLENSKYILDDIDKNSAVVMTHLQNEIGIINPIDEIAAIAGYAISDMSQSLGKIELNISELNVDIATFGCHKFGGINGVGFLYLKNPNQWSVFGTGSRYFTDRTGTPDVAGVAASAFALEESLKTLNQRKTNAIDFRTIIESGLKERGWNIVGEDYFRSPFVSFVQKEAEGIYKLLALNHRNIFCGLGSACGSNAAGLSPTLIGLGFKGHPHDFMRISQSGQYNKKDAEFFLQQFDLAN